MYAIDFHAHVFPDHIAEKAVPALAKAANARAYGTGTLSDLETRMDRAGVSKAVLVSIATKPSQARSINNWLQQQRNSRFIPFAAVHPEDPERFKEIERVKTLGFKGFKLHPNYQDFYPDEERIIDLARAIAGAGLILIIHGGVDWAYEEVNASPARMARLLDAVPDLTTIIAHFGGFERWDEVESTLAGSRAYFDISFTLPYIRKDLFHRIAEKHGIDRLLFATDYPWAEPAEQIRLLDDFDLSQKDKEAILHKNAENLLGLETPGPRE